MPDSLTLSTKRGGPPGPGCLTGSLRWRRATTNLKLRLAAGCATHRWCRWCWCCELWWAPGRCPADTDAPRKCRPCWRRAAGAEWKSPALSSHPSSAWCELQQQENVVSGVKLIVKLCSPENVWGQYQRWCSLLLCVRKKEQLTQWRCAALLVK